MESSCISLIAIIVVKYADQKQYIEGKDLFNLQFQVLVHQWEETKAEMQAASHKAFAVKSSERINTCLLTWSF